MPAKTLSAIGQYLYWSYSNLGMAHAALSAGVDSYNRMHYIIRNKMYAGLTTGTMKLGPMKDDERLKLILPLACCYCGSTKALTLDHLIPVSRGGEDSGDNLVWACRTCNCSKGATDLMEWHGKNGLFPSVLLLRRYMKIVIGFCVDNGLMGTSMDDLPTLPFSIHCIPHEFPPLNQLRLWVIPI
jgi:hypothetical protein